MMIVEPCALNLHFPYAEEKNYCDQHSPLLNNYNYIFNINQNYNPMIAHGPFCGALVRNKVVLCENCARELRDKIKSRLTKRIMELKKEIREKKEEEAN